MNIIDIIVGVLTVAILVVGSVGILGAVKEHLVDAENLYQANKFSMETLEEMQILPYADLIVNATPCDKPLDACALRDIRGGARSYVISEKNWGTSPDKYKEIVVTTTWSYKGQNKSVSLRTLRKDDN